MRLRERDKRPVVFRAQVTVKEADGTTYDDWGSPETIRGNVQPAGGKVMAEMYGERLAYMQAMYIEGKPNIPESSAACVFKEEPDYKVVAVRPWGAHTVVDLEAIRT